MSFGEAMNLFHRAQEADERGDHDEAKRIWSTFGKMDAEDAEIERMVRIMVEIDFPEKDGFSYEQNAKKPKQPYSSHNGFFPHRRRAESLARAGYTIIRRKRPAQ